MTKPKKSELKKTLSKRTATLLADGFKTVGGDAFSYIEESLYIDEAQSVEQFVIWANANHHRASMEMRFVEDNYPNLYKNYFLKEYAV